MKDSINFLLGDLEYGEDFAKLQELLAKTGIEAQIINKTYANRNAHF